jgi:hypothetical protein
MIVDAIYAVGRWMTFLMRLLKTRRPYAQLARVSTTLLDPAHFDVIEHLLQLFTLLTSRIRCWLHAWTGLLTRQRTYCRIV